MLVLQRNIGQRIMIGNDIVIELCEICGSRTARIGVTAPRDVTIHREEIAEKIREQSQPLEKGRATGELP